MLLGVLPTHSSSVRFFVESMKDSSLPCEDTPGVFPFALGFPSCSVSRCGYVFFFAGSSHTHNRDQISTTFSTPAGALPIFPRLRRTPGTLLCSAFKSNVAVISAHHPELWVRDFDEPKRPWPLGRERWKRNCAGGGRCVCA